MDAVVELGKKVKGIDLFQLNWTKLQCNKRGLLNDVCYFLASKDLDSSGVNDHKDVSAVLDRV